LFHLWVSRLEVHSESRTGGVSVMRHLRSNSVIGAQEEGSYEYISNHEGSENGKQEAHLESGVLYQPLGHEGGTAFGGVGPLCSTSVHEFCADEAGLVRGVRVRGFKLACTGVAVLVIACGGDDEIQRMAEADARGPVETPVVRTLEPRFDDPDEFDGDVPDIF
jgi:hypothetical protein